MLRVEFFALQLVLRFYLHFHDLVVSELRKHIGISPLICLES